MAEGLTPNPRKDAAEEEAREATERLREALAKSREHQRKERCICAREEFLGPPTIRNPNCPVHSTPSTEPDTVSTKEEE